MFDKIMRLVKERGLTLNRQGVYVYQKIKRLLDKKKITPYQLSKQIGIAPASFTDWKKGKAKPGTNALRKIAEYFEIPVSYFYENDGVDGEDGKVVQHIHDCEISGEVNGVKHIHECGGAAMLEGLTVEELDKVREYVEFIKSKRER